MLSKLTAGKFDLAPVYSDQDVQHWFLPQVNVHSSVACLGSSNLFGVVRIELLNPHQMKNMSKFIWYGLTYSIHTK